MLRKDQVETKLAQLQTQVERLKANYIVPNGQVIPPDIFFREMSIIEQLVERIQNLIEIED